MKLLHLFRHAKSSWEGEGLDDHERPLAPRGEKAAAAMGRFFAAEGIRPELVLLSSSARTRATFELALARVRPRAKSRILRELYLASGAELMRRIRGLEDGLGEVMVIAHNPGMQELATQLLGSEAAEASRRLAKKYPTAALATFAFEVDRWRRIKPGEGRLVRFVTPKELMAQK